MRRRPITLACGVAIAAFACAARPPAATSPAARATARTVAYLESPSRADWQKPDEVVAALHLTAGETVADLGAGTGYFARRLAAVVGSSGRIDALDVVLGLICSRKAQGS